MTPSIAQDVETIGRIAVVPTILQAVAHITGLRFAAVARVTDTRWTACAVYDRLDFGLQPGGELALESTLCNEIRQHHQPIVFGQASVDPHFAAHPTPKLYGFESYISIPIFRLDGEFFGTLCALDPLPAKLDDPNVVRTLELFAQLIAAQLDIEERLERSDSALLDANDTARLREQFIAVLGHDLRNPLQMISLGVEVLQRQPLDASARRTLGYIRQSCERMGELIHNILDFARGKLGGGIPVTLRRDDELADGLRQIIAEVHAAHPDHAIEAALDIAHPVTCDRHRIAQLLGNLLTNAVTHGAADRPVRVIAQDDGHTFELSVENGGPGIPAAMLPRLFQPFSRSTEDAPSPGLGLGLYIASEIARAHGGTLEVSSAPGAGARFVFRMPVESVEPVEPRRGG